ncbi:oligosaccharide flippase family protein [Aromatoleum toluvorans]|uniref:Oligosaccharide flippase family protein n=1 Tax=Aromatoleum toluvorans TaxID=92002 RepID=A0ABX1Q2R6_9RHOO|nr:oligosaccharide flippase family protein [Aromatoleum toluvorans]
MSERNSHREILRSSSIIGGASVINILLGLVRTKLAAVLLGPAGVGMIGLLQSVMTTASTASALGFGTVGTRQIAEAAGKEDQAAVAAARRALFWGTTGLAVIGGAAFWLLRDILAVWVLQAPELGAKIGWLAVGVTLSVAAGSQTALLNGLRRIGDLARISVASAVLSTLLSVGALLWLEEVAVLLFVLAAPISSFILGHWFVSRLGGVRAPATPLAQLGQQWRTMGRLGTVFMISGLVVTVGQLAVRTLVQRELGVELLGQFQAAWAIGMTYIGFVLTAMGTDYYPRLTAVIHDRETANRLANEQTEVALLLAGPIFLVMLGLAPWLIDLLYSRAFDDAVIILRWQVLGDVLKVASWPLGFIILAAGDGRTFMLSESAAIGAFVFFTWIGLPVIGVQATGVAFLVMYAVYLPLVYWLGRQRTGFAWERRVLWQFVALLIAAGAVFGSAEISPPVGGVLGVLLSLAFFVYCIVRLGAITNLGGPLRKISAVVESLMMVIRFLRK